MSELRYLIRENDPRPSDFIDVEPFLSAAFRDLHESPEGPRVTILELQPGDGTRYRVCLARLNVWQVVFTGLVPARGMCSFEYDLRGPCPDVYDEPFCALNPFTAAIYADVVRAVLWGVREPRRYDYKGRCPAGFVQP